MMPIDKAFVIIVTYLLALLMVIGAGLLFFDAMGVPR